MQSERFQITPISKTGGWLVGYGEPRRTSTHAHDRVVLAGEGWGEASITKQVSRVGVLTAGAVRTYGAADREIPFPGACMRPMIAGLPLRCGEHTQGGGDV